MEEDNPGWRDVVNSIFWPGWVFYVLTSGASQWSLRQHFSFFIEGAQNNCCMDFKNRSPRINRILPGGLVSWPDWSGLLWTPMKCGQYVLHPSPRCRPNSQTGTKTAICRLFPTCAHPDTLIDMRRGWTGQTQHHFSRERHLWREKFEKMAASTCYPSVTPRGTWRWSSNQFCAASQNWIVRVLCSSNIKVSMSTSIDRSKLSIQKPVSFFLSLSHYTFQGRLLNTAKTVRLQRSVLPHIDIDTDLIIQAQERRLQSTWARHPFGAVHANLHGAWCDSG